MPGEDGVYRVAALTLAVGTDLAQTSAGTPARVHGETAVAILTGHSATVVRVLNGRGVKFSLQFTPPPGRGHPQPTLSDGRQAVRFPDCHGGPRRFVGGITMTGRGCVRLRITTPGSAPATMLIPVAGSLADCPVAHGRATLSDAALPFLGVACGRANWIGCDQIGVGVHVDPRARLVLALIDGRAVTLSPPIDQGSGGNLWLGRMYRAGLLRGPSRVKAKPGRRWLGNPEAFRRAEVRAWMPDGQVLSTRLATVLLHAGFG